MPKLKPIELNSTFKMPEKPKFENQKKENVQKRDINFGKEAFDIRQQFDLSNYEGRFWS